MSFAFALKKLISAILMPLPLGMMLILLGFLLMFSRRVVLPKCLVGGGFLVLLLTTCGNLSRDRLAALESYAPPFNATQWCTPARKLDYVVVLGGRLEGDRHRPPSARVAGEVLPRLVEGIRVYQLCPGSKLVVSGGIPGLPDAGFAAVAGKLAEQLGVPGNDIIREQRPLDTVSEARTMQPLLQDSYFALVTSAWHMPRAVALFRAQGLKPFPAPAAFHTGRGRWWPNSRSLLNSEWLVHEKLGLLWAEIRGQTDPARETARQSSEPGREPSVP